MQSNQPLIKIKGKDFYIDVAFAELRQKDDPLNLISFFDMEDTGTHYKLRYDTDSCNIAELNSPKDTTVEVNLPYMVNLDPEAVARKYGIKPADLPEQDCLLKCPKVLWDQRMSGKLPEITVMRTVFTVDIRLNQLRYREEPWENVSLDDLELSPGGEKYLGLFNPDTQKLGPVDLSLLLEPNADQLLLTALPYEPWLDPVAFSRRYPEYESIVLDKYHYQYGLEARTFPVMETPLAKYINEAREQQQKEIRDIAPDQRPDHKNFGLGI